MLLHLHLDHDQKKRKPEASSHIELAINNLQQIKASVESPHKDEFTSFRKNIADQLRPLPLDKALYCQSHIMTFLTEQRIAMMTQTSTHSTVSSYPTASPSPQSTWDADNISLMSPYSETMINENERPQNIDSVDPLTFAIRNIGDI